MSSKLGSAVFVSFVSSAALLVGAGCAGSAGGKPAASAPAPAPASACSSEMPPGVAAPAGNRLAFELAAEGVQIYSCADSPGASGPGWALQAPEATLIDGRGAHAGIHRAGPTWEALDGSSVVGAKVATVTSDSAAIPWLLLRAATHGARGGRMADVTFVQRIHTSGGVAPSQGCSSAAVGTVARVPYRAVYCFYRSQGLRPDDRGVAPVLSHGSPRW